MSPTTFVIAAFQLAAVTTLQFPQESLEEYAHSAICPMNVTMDVNETRIPKVIRVIRCADVTLAQNSQCYEDGEHSCVELFDDVVVYKRKMEGDHDPYYSLQNPVEIRVPVGCVCMAKKFLVDDTKNNE